MEASGWLLEAEPVKQRVRWHRRGSVDTRVGSQKPNLQWPSRVPPCSPPLCHPMADGQELLASEGFLVGLWCYVCKAMTYHDVAACSPKRTTPASWIIGGFGDDICCNVHIRGNDN